MACATFLKFSTRDRSALTGGLLDHIAGKTRPTDYVTPRPELAPVVQMVINSGAVTAEAVAYVANTKRHHKAAPCVELLIAGPPPYEPNPTWETDSADYQEWAADRAHWTNERTEAWARANLRFLEKALPTAKIYQAAWHQDENAPHCHLAFIPCDEFDRISWRQLSAAAVGMEPPKGKTDKVQRAKIMAAWQDWHHHEVGRRFALERGESGSTRTHEPLTAKKRAAAAEQRRIAAEMERLRAERSALLTAFLAARDAACRISSGVPRWLRGEVSQVWEETTAAARGACAAVGLTWPAGDLVSQVALEREKQVDERIAADRDADYRAGYKRAAESVLAEGYQIGLATERAAAYRGVDPPEDPDTAEEWLANLGKEGPGPVERPG